MRYISNLLAGALFLSAAMSSCSNDNDMPSADLQGGSTPMRELTVTVAPMSRTTIEYENADYSHLVWNDGDEVAYITDVSGDTYRKATISHNTFQALVPEGATSSNKLTIVYPAGDLEGKASYDTNLALGNPAVLNIDGEFDGTRLPLTSIIPVPSTKSVIADFEVMGSVIRLNPIPGNHSEEHLTEVTLSADQVLAGSYRKSLYGFFFDGNVKSLTMSIESEDNTLGAINSNKRYIYIVVPRNSYTGVNLSLTTDAGTYDFNDGEMDLKQEGKTLYRLDLPLGEPTPVAKPMFKKITSMADVTVGESAKYVLVCEAKSVLYSEYNSNNYYEGVSVTIGEDGIDAEDETATKLQFSIFEYGSSSRPGQYYLKCDNKIGNKGWYIGMMPNFPGTPGKVFYDTSENYNENSWDISFDENGNVKLKGHPNSQDVAGDVFLGFYRPGNYFATYGQDASDGQIYPLQLYKLTE